MSADFPVVDREQPTEAERIADTQPSLGDRSTDDMWDLNRKQLTAGEAKWMDTVGLNHKLAYDGEKFDHRLQNLNGKIAADGHQYDNRIENLNQKALADGHVQALFWQNISERQLALQQQAQALVEQRQQFWQSIRQDAQMFADQRLQQAGLNNTDLSRARNGVSNDNIQAMKHNILAARVIEPTREENIADAAAGAVVQGVETVARAMTDRTQTSAANVSELSAARQVADTNVINTLAEVAGVVQTMQTQSATSQAAFQALTNQVSELVGALQALTGNQPRAGS